MRPRQRSPRIRVWDSRIGEIDELGFNEAAAEIAADCR